MASFLATAAVLGSAKVEVGDDLSQFLLFPLGAFMGSRAQVNWDPERFHLDPRTLYKVPVNPDKPFHARLRTDHVEPTIQATFRGVWVLHLVPQDNYDQGIQNVFSPTGTTVDNTFFLAGTDNCKAIFANHHFNTYELFVRSFGTKKNWMSNPMIILFSKPKFQGKEVTIELFKNGSYSQVDPCIADFFPRSSIVINSNWNIQSADGDTFCMLGQDDVLYLSDWESAGYKPPENFPIAFPEVTPGCFRRPYQVPSAQYLPYWDGEHFCHVAPETLANFHGHQEP